MRALLEVGFSPCSKPSCEYIILLLAKRLRTLFAPAVRFLCTEVEALFAKEHGRPENQFSRYSSHGERRGFTPVFFDGRNGDFWR